MDLVVVLDEWVRGDGPAGLFTSWSAYCAHVFASTPPGLRNRWVMDHASFSAIRAEHAAPWEPPRDPTGQDMLFGVPVTVVPGGCLPHLVPS